jgi:hypothetical protein
MLNTQIPSGLQALMQAAQILQQQASPSAPGPQGQQPTVAKQVEQAAAQQAMPDMQSVGQQAGIAGQMMAQRQQQQQQMAQDPQAVAQMAAQMLQRGIGGLPANMQFREGGIIGYDGTEGSDVRLRPIPDRDPAQFESVGERAERQRREKGSIYDPFYGLPPEVRAALEADKAAQREGTASPESYTIPGPGGPEEIPRTASERQRLEERRAALEARQQMIRDFQERRQRQQQRVAADLEGAKTASAQAGGAKRLEDYYVPYPERGPMRATTSTPGIAAVLESEFQRGAEAGAEPRPAPRAEPRAELRPEARPEPGPETLAAPSGIAAVAPRTRKTFEDIYRGVPEDAEAKAAIQQREEINRRTLEARRRQADLAQEGIAAIGKTETERKRLLELQRSEDALNSFIRLGQALRTGGDQYMAYSAGMKARDEADRVATLASQEAVLKLKQAQQAREMGDLELEKKFLDEHLAHKRQVEEARIAKAKVIADYESRITPAEIQADTAAANRAQDLQLKMAELRQKAEDSNNVKLANQVRLASEGLASAQRKIAQTLKDEFPNYAQIVSLQGISGKLDDNQRKVITDYEKRKRELETSSIAPIEALIAKLAKQANVELPEAKPTPSAAPAIRYNAQGQRIQ